jgi:hypothetical protein
MNEGFDSTVTPISVTSYGGQMHILVGQQVVATETSLSRLIDAAHALGENDPLNLRPQVSLLLDLPRREKATVLAAVSEHNTLVDQLWERDADLDGDYARVETRPAIETGILVDGRPWGWLFLMSSTLPDVDGRWQLIPAGSSETILDVTAGWWGDNMGGTGPYKDIGIRRWSDLAAVSWYDICDGPTSMRVDYEVEDWDKLFLDAFSDFFEGYYGPSDPLCPGCEETEDWRVSINANSMFSDELIGQALTEIYRPCNEHKGTPDVLFVEHVAGRDWCWKGTTWTPAPPGAHKVRVAIPRLVEHAYGLRILGKEVRGPETVALRARVMAVSDEVAVGWGRSSFWSLLVDDCQVSDGDRIVRAWTHSDSQSVFDSLERTKPIAITRTTTRYRAPSGPTAPDGTSERDREL